MRQPSRITAFRLVALELKGARERYIPSIPSNFAPNLVSY